MHDFLSVCIQFKFCISLEFKMRIFHVSLEFNMSKLLSPVSAAHYLPDYSV